MTSEKILNFSSKQNNRIFKEPQIGTGFIPINQAIEISIRLFRFLSLSPSPSHV